LLLIGAPLRAGLEAHRFYFIAPSASGGVWGHEK